MKFKFALIICLVVFSLQAAASEQGGVEKSEVEGAAISDTGNDIEEMSASHRKNRYRLINSRQKLGYAFGLQMGRTVKRMDVKVDLSSFLLGFKASFTDSPSLLDEEKAARIRERFYKKRREKFGRENLQHAVAFLNRNRKKPGILHTSSGLQYEEERKGYGARPKASDRVRVQYRGTLIDGTEFDSTYRRGKSIVFSVGRVTKGLSEGLKLMRVGGKTRFYISPDLAYGESGAGDKIEPNSALIYEVELLAIER